MLCHVHVRSSLVSWMHFHQWLNEGCSHVLHSLVGLNNVRRILCGMSHAISPNFNFTSSMPTTYLKLYVHSYLCCIAGISTLEHFGICHLIWVIECNLKTLFHFSNLFIKTEYKISIWPTLLHLILYNNLIPTYMKTRHEIKEGNPYRNLSFLHHL